MAAICDGVQQKKSTVIQKRRIDRVFAIKSLQKTKTQKQVKGAGTTTKPTKYMWSVPLSIGTNSRVAAGASTTTTKTTATIKTIKTLDSTDLSFVYKGLSDTTYIQQQNTFQYSTITSTSTSNNSNGNNISEVTFHSLLNDTNHHNNSNNNNNNNRALLNLTHNNDWSAHLYDSILSWQGFCLIAVFCIFIVITIIGNTLVILAVITTRRLKTVTNCFVMSLAVADLLVGIFVMPPAVAVHLIGSWQLGWVLCDIWISLDVLLCTASILSLCAISIDRYLAVTQPLTYSRRRRSKRLALVMILIVWLLALAITCPPMLGWYEPGRRDLNECRYNQNEGYVIFSAMGSFFIPMAVMIYVYARISCVVASRHDNMTDISVHNKKCKRHLSADGDNEGEHDLSELEFSSSQKKSRTLSNQTLAKDITEAVISSNEDNTGSSAKSLPTTTVPSQTPLPSKSGDNDNDELIRQTSLKYPTTGGGLTTVVNIQPDTSGRTIRNNAGEKVWSFSTTISQQQQQQQPQVTTQPTSTHMRSLSMRYQQKQQMLQQPQQLSLSTAATTQQESDNITITALSRQPTQRTQTTTTVHQHHHHHHHIHQHHPHGKSLASRISSLKKENKTTQTLSIVVGGFIACWLPFFINYLITPFLKEHQASGNLSKGLTWLGWFNSAINPFIYAFYSVDFRAAFWRLTCKRCLDNSNPKSAFPSNTMSIRR